MPKFSIVAFIAGLCFAACHDATAASRWTSSVDEATGLPTREAGVGRADSPGFAFWGEHWRWAGMPVK
ncbi:MAG: hypothetical protein H7276_23055, partial [Caulobacter sp.]|nr:hypothetical protein [Vitreoscilla sp.]